MVVIILDFWKTPPKSIWMVFVTILLGFGVIVLLALWRSHLEYQKSLVENLLPIYLSDKKRVSQYADVLSKLYDYFNRFLPKLV